MNTGRVLVVEDESKVIYLVREVLAAAGYEVSAVTNGELAIETRGPGPGPTWSVLDIILIPASLDGYEVARRVRRVSSGCTDHHALNAAGCASRTMLRRLQKAGLTTTFTKPFSSQRAAGAHFRRFTPFPTGRIRARWKEGREVVCDCLQHRPGPPAGQIDGREIHLTPTRVTACCMSWLLIPTRSWSTSTC